MSSEIGSSTLMPSALAEVRSILSSVVSTWKENQSVASEPPPIWQAAISVVDPEWAEAIGASINWLDHAPMVLISASQDITSSKATKDYAKIASSLEDLWGEVSKGNTISRLSGLSLFTPLSRLEALVEQCAGLDMVSQRRLKRLRDALDLSEDTQQLAAIIADTLPHLRSKAAQQRQAIDLHVAPTMAQAQQDARHVKMLDRAAAAFDLLDARIANEVSQETTKNRDSLERMVNEEEQLHTRLNTLSSKIARSIAGEHIETQSSAQSSKLALIANSPEPLSLPVVSSEVAQPKTSVFKGFLSGLTNRMPVWPPSKGSSSLMSSEANLPPISDQTKKLLVEVDDDYAKYPGVAWNEMRDALADPNIRASTRMPKSKMTVLDRLISPELLENGRAPREALPLVWGLLSKQSNLTPDTCNWERLLQVCVKSEFSETWDMVKIINHAGPLLDLAPHRDILAIKVLSILNNALAQASRELLVKFFNDYLTPSSLAKALVHLSSELVSARMPEETLKGLNPPLRSVVCLHALSNENGGFLSSPKEYIEDLFPKDRVELIKSIMVKPNSTNSKKLAEQLLSTPTVQSELMAPRTSDTWWSFALNDWAKLTKTDQNISNSTPQNPSPLPQMLVEAAISLESVDLLKYISDRHPNAVLDAPTSIGSTNTLLLSLINFTTLQAKDAQSKTQTFNCDYWCKAFKSQIDHYSKCLYVEEGVQQSETAKVPTPPQVGFSRVERPAPMELVVMTPLMQACYQGDPRWIKALLAQGADTSLKINGLGVGHMLKTHVLKEVMRKEEHRVDIEHAPIFLQDTFIRTLVQTMSTTGLWAIEDACPPSFIPRLLINCIAADILFRDNELQVKRQEAIVKYTRTLGRTPYLDIVASSIIANGQFDINSREVSKCLRYGVEAGLFEDSPPALQAARDELAEKAHQAVLAAENVSMHAKLPGNFVRRARM